MILQRMKELVGISHGEGQDEDLVIPSVADAIVLLAIEAADEISSGVRLYTHLVPRVFCKMSAKEVRKALKPNAKACNAIIDAVAKLDEGAKKTDAEKRARTLLDQLQTLAIEAPKLPADELAAKATELGDNLLKVCNAYLVVHTFARLSSQQLLRHFRVCPPVDALVAHSDVRLVLFFGRFGLLSQYIIL